MSAVETAVRLVGNAPEQQNAFNHGANVTAIQVNHTPADQQGQGAVEPDDTSHAIEAPQADDLVDALLPSFRDVLAETLEHAMDAAGKDGAETRGPTFQSALDDVLGVSKQTTITIKELANAAQNTANELLDLSPLLAFLALFVTLAACMLAGAEYQAACYAMPTAVALRDSGILTPEQLTACERRIMYWLQSAISLKAKNTNEQK